MSRALAALLALSVCACAATPPPGRRSPADQARLSTFKSRLAANDSATKALESWCSERHLAAPPQVRAEVIDRHYDGTIPIELPAAAGSADADGMQGYRHVRLRCGRHVLSEAFLWYNPSLLTAAMNDALDSTDAPFGKVVAPLGFRRARISEDGAEQEHCPAKAILSHAALLRLPDGHALAYVIECYTPRNLRGRT